MRHASRPLRSVLIVVGLVVSSAASPLSAQTRQSLVESALTEFDAARQRQLLRDALNPSLGVPDSAFAVAVQMLAQNLLEAGQGATAELWLRWAARLAPDLQPDPLQFPESVVSAFTAAQDVVRGTGGAAPPAWFWPAQEGGQGTLRVVARDPVSQLIVVQGVGSIAPGGQLSLDPGTYSARASAAGYAPAEVTLEILPGVTAEVAFSLPMRGDSVIAGSVESTALSSLVRMTAVRAGESTCGAGVLAGGSGLVLTTYAAIRGAERLTAAVGGADTPGEVRVAAYDAALNVAVLHVPGARSDSVLVLDAPVDGGFAWGLSFPECGTPVSSRTRLGAADPTRGLVTLEAEVAGGDRGGPLVDNTGVVVGLTLSPTTALSVTSAQPVLDEGRSNIEAGTLLAARDVALQERHLYGSVELRSEAERASVRVTPLESWHWSGAGRTASLPLVFAGPMGRYEVELLVDGDVRRRTEVVIEPEQLTQLAVNPGGGGGMGLVLGLVGIGAAGAGACVLFLCGGSDSTEVVIPPETTGEITFIFPNPAIRPYRP